MILDQVHTTSISAIVFGERHFYDQSSSVAYDWVHDLIYWIDFSAEKIVVGSGNGLHAATVINSGYITPQFIALHPGEG